MWTTTTFKKILFVAVFALTPFLMSCSQNASELQDGYYTAETAGYDANGWKEYITIYVSGDEIITVEYDARDANGFARSWDMAYMRKSLKDTGTYPNEYARTYTISLLNWQDPTKITAGSGSEESFENFRRLAAAAIEQAKTGDKQVAVVE